MSSILIKRVLYRRTLMADDFDREWLLESGIVGSLKHLRGWILILAIYCSVAHKIGDGIKHGKSQKCLGTL